MPLYEEALRLGLREPLRHRAQLQLASSLRNLGRHDEALAVVEDVAARHPESIGVAAFRALVTHDAGEPDAGPARPARDGRRPRAPTPTSSVYRRALTAYASELGG